MPIVPLLVIIYLAFVSLGLPDSALGIAWPVMRSDLGQPLERAGLLMLSTTSFSAISGFLSGRILGRFGTGPVVMISGFLTGGALIGYSLVPSMAWLLVLTVPLGFGAGSVDAALNHFVAEHYSARHMNWLHGCWGLGATVGPLIFGEAIARGSGWRGGYWSIGLIQLILATIFIFTLPHWKAAGGSLADPAHSNHHPILKPLRYWSPWLALSLFVVYSTIEVVPALWAATILIEDRHLDPLTASGWLSCFYGAIMIGRFAIGFIATRIGNRNLVRLGLLTALTGSLLFSLTLNPPLLSLIGLVLMGLGCAPIYPSLMHETPRRFDPEVARRVIGQQVAVAYLGAAIMPGAFGMFGAWAGLWTIIPGVSLATLLLLLLSELLNRVT